MNGTPQGNHAIGDSIHPFFLYAIFIQLAQFHIVPVFRVDVDRIIRPLLAVNIFKGHHAAGTVAHHKNLIRINPQLLGMHPQVAHRGVNILHGPIDCTRKVNTIDNRGIIILGAESRIFIVDYFHQDTQAVIKRGSHKAPSRQGIHIGDRLGSPIIVLSRDKRTTMRYKNHSALFSIVLLGLENIHLQRGFFELFVKVEVHHWNIHPQNPSHHNQLRQCAVIIILCFNGMG